MSSTIASPSVAAQFLSEDKGLWIDNEYTEAIDGASIESLDPATGERLVAVAAAAEADVDRAVASARRAFEGAWGRLTPDDRGRLLFDLAALVEENADELAYLETLDNGKPITASKRDDVPGIAATLRYYAGWTTKNVGQTIPVSSGNFHCYTRHEPVGVCAGIIPWNYPIWLAVWKFAPALACGNTMVLKPAEQTPVSVLRLAELARDAGFPPGALNVVNGYGETCGAALTRHPDVAKVSFTGETSTGQRILEASLGNLKRVSLELGGKSPNVVFADAPSDVVEGSAWAILYNTGQDCTAGSRIFVEKDRYDDFLIGLVEQIDAVKVGPGIDPATGIGPLVSTEHMERVLGYIDLARAEATVASGGERLRGEPFARGNFVSPAVVTDTSNEMRIAREEIFGPVVTVMPFSSEEELIAKANDTQFGLGAGVWTSDVKRAHRVAAALEAGTVWVNCWAAGDPAAPFGGFKMSGNGREMGSYSLDLYTETKCVWVNLD